MTEKTDLIVLGAGPGGYVAAIRAAQLGMQVTLVEKNPALGGTCLNVGCIPSKALLESSALVAAAKSGLQEHGLSLGEVKLDLSAMLERKHQIVEQLTGGIRMLMKKNKVQVVHGKGRLLSGTRMHIEEESGSRELDAGNILLATGSVPAGLPGLPLDGKQIVSSTEALSFDQVPKHLLVVGAGAVGLELGLVWSRLGATVTVVELLDQIVPFADRLIARTLQRALKVQGMEFHLKTKVVDLKNTDAQVEVTLEDTKGGRQDLRCDKVLVSVGRTAYLEGLGLADAGIALDERGKIAVNDKFQTSVDTVYAIGDVIRGPMLAHKAEDEGIAVAEILAGLPGEINYDVIPSVVYTTPELAQVGLTEQQAEEQGLEIKTGKFFFKANGRALCAGETDGLVKIIADAKTDKILGVHILGPHASELIAEAVIAMELGASSEDIARTVHAHPTLSEAVREAALAVDGRAIHG